VPLHRGVLCTGSRVVGGLRELSLERRGVGQPVVRCVACAAGLSLHDDFCQPKTLIANPPTHDNAVARASGFRVYEDPTLINPKP